MNAAATALKAAAQKMTALFPFELDELDADVVCGELSLSAVVDSQANAETLTAAFADRKPTTETETLPSGRVFVALFFALT
jgi:hypothetical protein